MPWEQPASANAGSEEGSLSKRPARCQHDGCQVWQRPVQVVLTRLDRVTIHADVVDGCARDRVAGRHGCQGAGDEVFPQVAIVSPGGVHHAALRGAVLLDPGHHHLTSPFWHLGGAMDRIAQGTLVKADVAGQAGVVSF